MSVITSERLERFERKMPFMADVTQMLPGLRTPRIVMQEWVASMTTATPFTSSSSISRLAISSVIRSCTCGRCETLSTTRASLLKPDDFAVGDVTDVGDAGERQHVVLAHAVEADVANEHHLIVLFGEEFAEVQPRLIVQAGKQLGVHASHAGRRFAEAFAVGVFADGGQNFADGAFDARLIDLRRFCRAVAFGEFAGEAAEVAGGVGGVLF